MPLMPTFPGYVSEITTKAVEEYKARGFETVKPATVNKELALLKRRFTKVEQEG